MPGSGRKHFACSNLLLSILVPVEETLNSLITLPLCSAGGAWLAIVLQVLAKMVQTWKIQDGWQ